MPECNDPKCPIHGSIKVRGNIFTGEVIRDKAHKTVLVEMVRTIYVKKYERYKKARSRIAAYNPECINARLHDIVEIGETRKLSKTKSFVVLKKHAQSAKAVAKKTKVAE